MKIDLTRQSLPEEGIHNFIVADLEYKEGQNGEYALLTAVISEQTEDAGKEVRFIISFSPNARWKLDSFLDALGLPTSGEFDFDQVVGMEFRGLVKHEDYDGNIRATISNFIASTKETKPNKVRFSGKPNVKEIEIVKKTTGVKAEDEDFEINRKLIKDLPMFDGGEGLLEDEDEDSPF